MKCLSGQRNKTHISFWVTHLVNDCQVLLQNNWVASVKKLKRNRSPISNNSFSLHSFERILADPSPETAKHQNLLCVWPWYGHVSILEEVGVVCLWPLAYAPRLIRSLNPLVGHLSKCIGKISQSELYLEVSSIITPLPKNWWSVELNRQTQQ